MNLRTKTPVDLNSSNHIKKLKLNVAHLRDRWSDEIGGHWEWGRKKVPTSSLPQSMNRSLDGLRYPRGLRSRRMPWKALLYRQWPLVLSARPFARGMTVPYSLRPITASAKVIRQADMIWCRVFKSQRTPTISEIWVKSIVWGKKLEINLPKVSTPDLENIHLSLILRQ